MTMPHSFQATSGFSSGSFSWSPEDYPLTFLRSGGLEFSAEVDLIILSGLRAGVQAQSS